INPPSACRFHPRCPRFQPGTCDVEDPPLEQKDGGAEVACHFPLETWPMSDLRLPASQPGCPPVRAWAERYARGLRRLVILIAGVAAITAAASLALGLVLGADLRRSV